MVNSSSEFFSLLLRRSLWGNKEVFLYSKISLQDLRDSISIAKSQSVLGLVANVILSDSAFSEKLPVQESAKLKHFVMSNLSTSQMLNNSLLLIVQELRKHGVDPVLLKGQGIAKYYPVPELRQCGDIDIYVGQKDFEKTCNVIGAMSTPEDHQGDIPSLKHFHTRIGNAFIEIHRYTDVYYPKRLNRVYQKISDDGMSSGLVPLDFSGVSVLSPSVNFNVFFIFNHFWHHFIADGVGLRQICDWVLLLHHNYGKIDLQYLESVLNQMGLMKQWKVFGCIAVDVLGLPRKEMPFYDNQYQKLSVKVLDLIMLEGNFGKENLKGYKRPEGYVAGKWYSFRKRVKRNLRVLRLFPKDAFRHMRKVFFGGIVVMFNDKFGD